MDDDFGQCSDVIRDARFQSPGSRRRIWCTRPTLYHMEGVAPSERTRAGSSVRGPNRTLRNYWLLLSGWAVHCRPVMSCCRGVPVGRQQAAAYDSCPPDRPRSVC